MRKTAGEGSGGAEEDGGEATEENRRETGSAVRLVPAHTSHPILRSLTLYPAAPSPRPSSVPRALEMKPNFSLPLPRLTLLATLQPTSPVPFNRPRSPAVRFRGSPPPLFAIPCRRVRESFGVESRERREGAGGRGRGGGGRRTRPREERIREALYVSSSLCTYVCARRPVYVPIHPVCARVVHAVCLHVLRLRVCVLRAGV